MIPPTLGGTKTVTISTIASKDSFVKQTYPNANYGHLDFFLLGRDAYSAAMEAYFYFDFSDKPSSWTKAEISIEFYSILSTTNVTMYLIERSWEELSITWNNKPSKDEIITSFLINAEDSYKNIYFDVSSYIVGRTNISICLWTPEVISYQQIQGTTRENYNPRPPGKVPHLIWTYPETTSITVSNPTSSTHLTPGSLIFIIWTTQGPIDEVDINFYKGGALKYYLVGVVNVGSYYWSIPEDIEPGTDWNIWVRDSDDSSTYDFSEDFEIFIPDIRSLTIFIVSIIFIITFILLSIIMISEIFIKRKSMMN